MPFSQIQIGKKGLSDNFIETLKSHFKKHNNIRISVLESAGREKGRIKEYSEKILDFLGKEYTSRIIGFTIVIKKWRKNVRD